MFLYLKKILVINTVDGTHASEINVRLLLSSLKNLKELVEQRTGILDEMDIKWA